MDETKAIEIEESSSTQEAPETAVEVSTPEEFKEKSLDIKVEMEEEESVEVPEEKLCNLEQQMSEFDLNEQKEQEVELVNEPVEDIEMKEEPQGAQELQPVEEPPVMIETEVKEEVSTEIPDKEIEFMEFDDAKFVRRSRRLQSIYIDPPAMKVEDPAPVPPPEEKSAVLNLSELELKFEKLPEPAIVETLPPKPAINIETRVPHTDERLKRYETIRDNIYSKKSDKKVCKVNKTMKCDCTITEEEVKNGELGCHDNCINRILYIECGVKCRCGGELV